MTETKESVAHFSIEGVWFTWFLRHLWIEGNEVKAVRAWTAAFPHLAEENYIRTVFLDVVSGRKKFTGYNEFQLVKDGTKYWSPTAGSKPSKAYPLYSTWEDVLERKRLKLFLAELELRDIRLNRKYAPTRDGNGYRSDKWIFAADENSYENAARKKAADLLAAITNIGHLTKIQVEPIDIPTEGTLLEDKSVKHVKKPSRRVKYNPSLDNNRRFYNAVVKIIDSTNAKFKKKYGEVALYYGEQDLMFLCGLDEDDKWNQLNDAKPQPDYIPWKDALKKASPEVQRRFNSLTMASAGASAIIPGLNLETYMQNMMRDDDRKTIEPEDVGTMEWDSGYIAPTGEFYGCADIAHREFSQRLCEKFGFGFTDAEGKPKGQPSWLKVKRGDAAPKRLDAEVVLDEKGWVRVSVKRFFWDPMHKLTEQQKKTIKDFMSAKKMDAATFNNPLKTVSYEEGIKE